MLHCDSAFTGVINASVDRRGVVRDGSSPDAGSVDGVGAEEGGRDTTLGGAPHDRSLGQSNHILVVESNETRATTITHGLEHEGFRVSQAENGRSGLELFFETGPNVVILDAQLAELSGIDVCRRIRESGSSVPVIVLSDRAEELDVVVAMEIGADDFLARPYRMRELVARVRAVLRRSSPHVPTPTVPMPTAAAVEAEGNPLVLQVDDLVLDLDRHKVYRRGELVELTRQEFWLLEELMRNPGLLLRRETLLESIWGPGFDGDGRILSTLVMRLRARIEDDPDSPVRIVTIRGLGYRYAQGRNRASAN